MRLIKQEQPKSPYSFEIPLTGQQLASLTGLCIETTIRTIEKWKKKKYCASKTENTILSIFLDKIRLRNNYFLLTSFLGCKISLIEGLLVIKSMNQSIARRILLLNDTKGRT